MKFLYSQGWEYFMEQDYSIQTPFVNMPFTRRKHSLSPSGVLTLEEGYAWDGATWWPDFKTIIRSSAIHDAFCQAMRDGDFKHSLYREVNQFFYECCLESGMWVLHAKIVLMGVNLARSGDPAQGPSLEVFEAR